MWRLIQSGAMQANSCTGKLPLHSSYLPDGFVSFFFFASPLLLDSSYCSSYFHSSQQR